MRTRNVWINGLVLCAFLGGLTAHAAELKVGVSSRTLRNARGDTVVVKRLPLDPEAPNGAITMTPLRAHMDTVHLRTGPGAADAVASGAEKLIYDNPIGNFVLALPPNQLVADDITVLVANGCNLRRYSFSVVGRANPAQTGGPFSVSYALYDNCPQAGGVGSLAIPGTEGVANFVDDSVIHTIEFVVATGVDVPIPPTVWLGIQPNRFNVGVIGGAPAFVGFSDDRLDFPGLACNADAGGFPNSPQASFTASVYGDAACADTYPAYRNISPGRGGFNEGPRWCFADDLQLNDDGCLLTGYDVGVRLNANASSASFRFRLLRDAAGLPGAEIPDTFKAAAITGGTGAYAIRVTVADPNGDPIPLNTDRVWLAFESTADGGGWILTRRNASIGNSTEGFARSISGRRCAQVLTNPDWEAQPSPDPLADGSFEVTLHCGGHAPVGACCDMFLTDDGLCVSGSCVGGEFDGLECFADLDCQGDPMCRDLPVINCSFPPRNTGFRPAWQKGVACRKCTGGANDGLTCTSDEKCPGGTCAGAAPFGSATPCGVAACCTPQEDCQNLSEKACAVLDPPYEPNKRQWQIGKYCGSGGQRCPRIACLGREGSCTEARPRMCSVGGVINDMDCSVDSECKAFCGDPRCFGGTNSTQPCSQPGDCPGGTCKLRCVGGALAGLTCTADTQCNDDGLCEFIVPTDPSISICIGGENNGFTCQFNFQCPGGVCANQHCVAGSKDGQACTENRECADAFCPGFPGCENPLCCTAVCDEEFRTQGTTFCCDFHWFQSCANIAAEEANTGDCFLTAENDSCRPIERSAGATTIALGGTTEVPMKGSVHTPGTEPGFCCHNGFENHCVRAGVSTTESCFQDSDCYDAVCTHVCVGGPSNGNVCTGFKKCFNFASFQFTDLCTSDFDCPAGDPCKSPECFDLTPNGAGTCSDLVCVGGPANGVGCSTQGPTADCNADRFCVTRERQPGASAGGTVWYRFTIPPGPDPVSVVVNTCRSQNTKATDSLLQVFGAVDPDRGVCEDLGRCANGDACNLGAPSCSDASNCNPQQIQCSISGQDCPLSLPCVVDLVAQCDALVLLGCNDDDPGGCAAEGHADRPGNAKLCVPDLTPGETYFVEMGHKGLDFQFGDTDGVYRLDVSAAASCPGDVEANDSCRNALDVGDGAFPFDLDKATFDCPAPDCLPGSRRDVWFRYTAPVTGTAIFSTCGPDLASTPNTEMALYDTCECPTVNAVIPAFKCSFAAGGECGEGSLISTDVQAGDCFMVRVGDRNFLGGTGNLTITTLGEDCNTNGIEDVCDVDCALPGCSVSGCGQSIDCNSNQIPDECEQDTGCCPSGTVTFTSPVPAVIDAGFPLDPFDSGVPLGIQTIEVSAPAGAGPECWDLCETANTGVPNGLTVTDHGDGTYTLTLDRPITPGACTTITFLAGDGSTPFANFRSHPGNVNADGLSNAGDVQSLLALLNSPDPVGNATYGLFSVDVNRSGTANAADIIALIDTLNGPGPLTTWSNSTLPSCSICQPTQ